jgi:hypothetical protein
MDLLSEEDRVTGVSNETCARGTMDSTHPKQAGPVIRRAVGTQPQPPAVGDPIACAVQLLTHDQPARAKVLLFYYDGRGDAIPWRKHLTSILHQHIGVSIYTVPSEPKGPTTQGRIGPVPYKWPRQLPPAVDALDELANVTGGQRIEMNVKERSFATLMGLMKDAMLLSYYPPEEPDEHTLRIEVHPPAGVPAPEFRYQLRYVQSPR